MGALNELTDLRNPARYLRAPLSLGTCRFPDSG
jgi:hypothetical protein